jgi:molecular chaperone DnaK
MSSPRRPPGQAGSKPARDASNQWKGQELVFRLNPRQSAQLATVVQVGGDHRGDLTMDTAEPPPPLGAVLLLQASLGPGGDESAPAGTSAPATVVSLTTLREGPGGTRIVVELMDDAAAEIDRLLVSAASTFDSPPERTESTRDDQEETGDQGKRGNQQTSGDQKERGEGLPPADCSGTGEFHIAVDQAAADQIRRRRRRRRRAKDQEKEPRPSERVAAHASGDRPSTKAEPEPKEPLPTSPPESPTPQEQAEKKQAASHEEPQKPLLGTPPPPQLTPMIRHDWLIAATTTKPPHFPMPSPDPSPPPVSRRPTQPDGPDVPIDEEAVDPPQPPDESEQAEEEQPVRPVPGRASTPPPRPEPVAADSPSPAPVRAHSQGQSMVLAIDFGTTFSKAAVLREDKVQVIEDGASLFTKRTAVPSVVALTELGGYLVGHGAKQLLAVTPERVIPSVKRLMGLTFSDRMASGVLGTMACTTQAGPNDSIIFDIEGTQLTTVDVAAEILKYLVGVAEEQIGTALRRVVLTHPVDFNEAAQRELRLAARMADLDVLALLPEPVAAVMGSSLGPATDDGLVVVYDFGGGTLDLSVLRVNDGEYEVLGSAGDRWLGGDDFDALLARHSANVFQGQTDVSLHNRTEEFQRLLFASEEAKRMLTMLPQVDVVLPNAALTAKGPQTLCVPLKRREFEELASDILGSADCASSDAMFRSDEELANVGTLLLTGGTCRIPVVRQRAEQFFDSKGTMAAQPEQAVVIGAALHGARLAGWDVPDSFGPALQQPMALRQEVAYRVTDGKARILLRQDSALPATVQHRLELPPADEPVTLEFFGTNDDVAPGETSDVVDMADLQRSSSEAGSVNVVLEVNAAGQAHLTVQHRGTGYRARQTFSLPVQRIRSA